MLFLPNPWPFKTSSLSGGEFAYTCGSWRQGSHSWHRWTSGCGKTACLDIAKSSVSCLSSLICVVVLLRNRDLRCRNLQICDCGSDGWDREKTGVILTTATAQSVRLVVALSEARGTLRYRRCQFQAIRCGYVSRCVASTSDVLILD